MPHHLNLDLQLRELQRKLKGVRGLCRIIDFEIENLSNERHLYLFTEAYNASLSDLYYTNKNENMEFTEDQLVEYAF